MTTTKKCIGSAKFGIEAHEAPVGNFPIQPSQKDGLGRMCKTHWTEYTRALRKAKAQGGTEPTVRSQAAAKVAMKRAARVGAARPAKNPEPIRTHPARGRKTEDEQIVEAVDAEVVQEAANAAEASIA